MTKKIGVLIGSLRRNSYTKKVAEDFINRLPEGYEAVVLKIDDLPFYNEELEDEGSVPEEWTRFREQMKEVSGIYFFTPEYNRSIPAVIKNALDVGSRPFGQNIWDNKPALVVSVSPGAIGGFGANHHLRQSLTVLNVPILQQPEAYIGNVKQLIEKEGAFTDATQKFFDIITKSYINFYEKLTK